MSKAFKTVVETVSNDRDRRHDHGRNVVWRQAEAKERSRLVVVELRHCTCKKQGHRIAL